MKKHLINFTLLFVMLFTNAGCGQILTDDAGNKFITLGSTKDEVIEVLGTPSKIHACLNDWYYGSARIGFDGHDGVKEYTDAKALKIRLLPSTQKAKSKGTTPSSCPPYSTQKSSNGSKAAQSNTSSSSSAFIATSSGYGEISENTGRPKTVAIKGYTRKDGTYVKPHYRSSPKGK